MILLPHGFTQAGISGVSAGRSSVDSSVARFGRWKEKRKYTIFLVEDDRVDRNIILYTLQRSPLVNNVHSFDTGDSMLRHFIHGEYYRELLGQYAGQSAPPLLVLLNIRFPGTDGIGILKALKDDVLTEDIPVALMTGLVSPELPAAASG
jgi:CheY-like chemotaxis protein